MHSPSLVLSARYELEELLASCPSVTGRQCEQMQVGLSGRPPGGAPSDRLERLRLALADAVLLTADLSFEEEQVCRLRYTGSSAGPPPGRWPSAEAQMQARAVKTYERTVWDSDLRTLHFAGTLPSRITDEGEEWAAPAKDETGAPVKGRAVVRGKHTQMSLREVGERLGLSERQVQSRIHSACCKVRTALDARAARTPVAEVAA